MIIKALNPKMSAGNSLIFLLYGSLYDYMAARDENIFFIIFWVKKDCNMLQFISSSPTVKHLL